MADETLMDLIDAYAEARHAGGCHTYNDKTAEARAKVLASLAANAGSEPNGYQKALDIRIQEGGWELSGSKVPVLYTDSINGRQVCRDDVWLCTTEAFTHTSPPEGMAGWMPIETAPKDGKLILVHFKSKGVRAVSWDSPFHDEVTEENGIWCVDDDKHGPFGLRGYNDDGPTAPTHWMPLPAAPGPADGESNGY